MICSSLLGEFATNYHRERQLAQELVSRGIGVLRFHYAGEGNSFGERERVTFDTMCEDAQVALSHAQTIGFEKVALLGTRLGALVAAKLAARREPSPLGFWEPAVEPLSFVEDARRANKMSLLVQSGLADLSNWRVELEREGVVDLLGHDLHLPLVESLENLAIPDLLGDVVLPILIAGLGTRRALLESLAGQLSGRGSQVTIDHFQAIESSWLGGDAVNPTSELVIYTADWFQHQLGVRP
jgi:hypothetical protein